MLIAFLRGRLGPCFALSRRIRGALCTIPVLFALVPAVAPAAGAGLPPVSLGLTPPLIDAERCAVFEGDREVAKASPSLLQAILGLTPTSAPAAWVTPPLPGEIRHFRIAFTQPVPIGTICMGGDGTVSLLKGDAPYPGDPGQESQWTPGGKGPVLTLPAGTATRAIRITQRVSNLPWDNTQRPATLGPLLVLSGRYWSPAQLGASDSSEVDAGKGVRVKQWTAFWPRAQALAGLAIMQPLPTNATCLFLGGADDVHPLAADAAAWKPLAAIPASGAPAALAISPAVTATAVRVRMPPANTPAGPPSDVIPLVALRSDDLPPASFLPTPPFTFPYNMPMDGFAAIRIRDASGQDVRRLIAEVERPRGPVTEGWDLRNDAGLYVKPGRYAWRGIFRPPLKLTYEITVYNAGHPPWLAPVPGGGWWMSDHGPPRAACAVKDTLFFGAAGAEFGIPLIATDLEGRKVWHFNQGVERLTSDGRYAYVVNDDAVVRFDPQHAFARKEILRFAYSDEVPPRAEVWIQADQSGAAARDGLLAVSYNAPEPGWITSAFKPGEVDLSRCFPPPTGEKVHETAYTPNERILGTFLTIPSSTQAWFGKAPSDGSLAHVLLLALAREVPLGSVLVPSGNIQVWALRPGKSLPPRFTVGAAPADTGGTLPEAEADEKAADLGLNDEEDVRFAADTWVRLPAAAAGRPAVAQAPDGGTRTRCIAFTSSDLSTLDYALALNRRFRDAAPDAQLVLTEGQPVGPAGWTTTRDARNPISLGNPPTAALVWKAPVPLRGCALVRPMPRANIAFDVWTGPADAEITATSVKDDGNWKQVYLHQQNETHIKLSWHTARVVQFDFGSLLQIRALRIRIVSMPTRGAAPAGGFESLIAFQPIGGDPPMPPTYAQRITLVELPSDENGTAHILKHLAVPHPGALAFDASGRLYAATERGIVRMADPRQQPDQPKLEVVIPKEDVKLPRAVVLDDQGALYVLDGATRSVRVYDATTGAYRRTIGTPGGTQVGPWDPTRLTEPVAMTLDSTDKLWIVDQSFQPKRISRWSTDGKFEKDFMGPTHYGGGGFVDPGDHTIVNHVGMKFRVDYATRTWKLESILNRYWSRGMFMPDRAVYVQGRRYLVGDHPVLTVFGDPGPTVVICVETNGVAVPIVAAGQMSGWTQFGGNEEVLAAYRSHDLADTSFVWCDLNRDTKAQPEEVQIRAGKAFLSSAGIGDDLSLNFLGYRLRLQSLRQDGLPLYDMTAVETVPELNGRCMVTADGETFVMGHKLLSPDGKVLWSYPDPYMTVQMSYRTPWGFYDRPPGELCGSLAPAGSFMAGNERLFCVNGNNGDYYAFTRDGLLAAAIVGGPRGYGRRFFSMPDCVPGKTDLSDLRKTVEDFDGWITRAEDGNVYATVGKNHVTVIRADGLEKMQRAEGTLDVTKADIQAAMLWAADRARVDRALRRPTVFVVPYLNRKPTIDGEIHADWPPDDQIEIHTIRDQQDRVIESWNAKLGYDSDNLYIAARGVEASPLMNTAPAAERNRLFQFGDGLDLQIGLDPKADANRQDTAAGDVRLVLTEIGGKPRAMLYRYQGTGAAVTFRSPVSEITIADVRELPEATIRTQRQGDGTIGSWTIEASIPWKALGAQAPGENVTLRGDIGVLVSDPQGLTTVTRYYWANKANVVMSDLPSEARVLPALWGEFRFAPADLESVLDDNQAAPGALLDDIK